MIIDIINYTDEQYAKLSEEQILEVQSAQLKKNKLLTKMQAELDKEKHRLVKNGVYFSKIFSLYQEKLQQQYDLEVEQLRESLLFYLRFSAKPSDSETEAAPYEVDYSLSIADRYALVKEHYLTAYDDPQARLDAFKMDTVALQYLGEMYSFVYDEFYNMI